MNFFKKTSLSTRVLIGLGLGILLGLFIGEWVGPLGMVGDGFILLLQMPVLPYVALSLIASLGRLDYQVASQLAKKGGALLLVLWLLSLIMVALYPLSFPNWESASFFSTSMIKVPDQVSFLGMYIPANIFKSLSDNMVPAVVLFSVIFGVTLIGMKEKESLLDQLDVGVTALSAISRNIAELAPIGVFAIGAHAAGTLAFEDLGRLQVYVFTYLATSLVMALWVMPGMIAALTPLSYRQVVGPIRDVLVTAFATGNLFIVLPMLSDRAHKIVTQCFDKEHGFDENQSDAIEESKNLVDVIVPTSFNFPNVGKLMTLTFVPFAGWFSGFVIPQGQMPTFLVSGLFTFFGSIPVAIPFLLEQLRIPSDMFQIYLVLNNLVNVRVGTLMSAMHIIVLSVLGAYVIMGRPLQWKGLIRYGVFSVVLTIAAIGGTRLMLEATVPHDYTLDDTFVDMKFTREYPRPTIHVESQGALPEVGPEGRLASILGRGFLRVGYFPDRLPFVYINNDGRMAGYDAEMAHLLAQDLDVELEFVKLQPGTAIDALNEAHCDLIMSGFVITVNRLKQMEFTRPYMNQTMAFLVPDHEVQKFNNATRLVKQDSLRIGVPNDPFILQAVKSMVPRAQIEVLNSPREYMKGNRPELDAVVNSAEGGSAWCLIYPAYSVAVPIPNIHRAPTAYPVAQNDTDFAQFITRWIDIKDSEGELDKLFNHWIVGKNSREQGHRWCVLRDVMGLGD